MTSRFDDPAARARDAGMATAVEHADRVQADWSARALALVERYARVHDLFTTEDVRRAVERRQMIELPPDKRAWGSVVTQARKLGILAAHDYVTAKDPKVHKNVVRRWRSLLHPKAEQLSAAVITAFE